MYLGLLPPQQIIEICLTFDAHVPSHVRSSVWPLDLKAAIAATQRQSRPLLEVPTANLSTDTPFKTTLAADVRPTTDSPPAQPDKPPKKPPEIIPPSHEQSSDPLSGSAQTVTAAPPINNSTPITQPHYSHQPYGFPQQQASYPHAPYYNSPLTSFNYAHSSYPSYPLPTRYPQSATTSVSRIVEAQLSAEDLPSYEDIIVEALMGCPDPEGSVPKNIFAWMSSHYPLQSNFRPSASQALQKAYKRGRFEKSSNGKYRLNPLWEGGSVSLRS